LLFRKSKQISSLITRRTVSMKRYGSPCLVLRK
jgi:hypothetical protein